MIFNNPDKPLIAERGAGDEVVTRQRPERGT